MIAILQPKTVLSFVQWHPKAAEPGTIENGLTLTGRIFVSRFPAQNTHQC